MLFLRIFLHLTLVYFCLKADDLLSKFTQSDYQVKDIRTEVGNVDEQMFSEFKVTTFKYNRSTSAINLSFICKIDVRDKVEILVQMYKFISNEYRVFPVRFQVSLTKAYKANIIGAQSVTKCGFLNGTYFLKTLTVLNPFRTPDTAAVQDTDFAGPLVFCLAFGGFLLLSGKVHFSYIYGFGALGCLLVWILLSMMSTQGVTLGTVVTVLGYCLLPMVALSGVNVVFSLQGYVGVVLTSISILWCSLSASKLFITALLMEHQQPLVLYPCALLYGVFALITIF